MRSISIFNNKGGVGKTTLACNLASYIGQEQKVLLIDLDPQCNSTSYLLNEEEQLDWYEGKNNKVSVLIDPLNKGKGYYQKKLPVIKSERFGIDILPGDTKLALQEDFLAEDWIKTLAGSPRGLQTTFVFSKLLNDLDKDYDYVFFDLGPSLGALNRTALLACDYFIIPMTSDLFSLQALDNIGESLNSWKKGIESGLSSHNLNEGSDFEIDDDLNFSWKLKFLGYVTQQYTARKENGKKRAVKAFDSLISKMPEKIKHKIEITLNGEVENFIALVGEIPNLHSLVPLSQSNHKPIFKLGANEEVFGAHIYKVKDFKKLISEIKQKIFLNLRCLES